MSEIPIGQKAQTADGREISATQGVFPILQEIGVGKLKVIGTGFYITRYGLFLSAAHVFDDLFKDDETKVRDLRIFHHTGSIVHIRHIKRITKSNVFDVAIGEADNFADRYPNDPLQNVRARLTLSTPKTGANLVTFAYPRNWELDFTDHSKPVEIFADRFYGKFECIMEPSKYDPNKTQLFQSTIPLEGGCSGGPIFDETGRVFAIARSSFDFGGFSDGNTPVSTLTPLTYCLFLESSVEFIPKNWWERSAVTGIGHRNESISVQMLAKLGCIEFDPKLRGHNS